MFNTFYHVFSHEYVERDGYFHLKSSSITIVTQCKRLMFVDYKGSIKSVVLLTKRVILVSGNMCVDR